MSKQFYFRAIQFSISTQFNSIWPIDRSLRGATTWARLDLKAMAINGVLCIP